MQLLGQLLMWIIIGGIVGYAVSLLMGQRFKGGPLMYVIVGIITVALLGFVGTLLKLVWLGIIVAGALIIVAAIVRALGVAG